MSDLIYSSEQNESSDNIVLVAQACRGVLTKRHYINAKSKSYDQVKYFNFFHVKACSLFELYMLSKRMLNKPRCCYIRAQLKDQNDYIRKLRRLYDRDDGEATLIPYRCNWFAIDIDGYDTSWNDLESDARRVLLALGWDDIECFAVASASYGIKPAIHMRLFLWSQELVSLKDLSNAFKGNKVCVDMGLYTNPIQPIYTAAPIFEEGMIDPVEQRIIWIQGRYASVNIRPSEVHVKGAAEIIYNKQQADAQSRKYLSNISRLIQGERHTGLIKWCYPLGKLVGQGHFDRDDMIERVMDHCSFWNGRRDQQKDRNVIKWTIDRGIDSISKGEAI